MSPETRRFVLYVVPALWGVAMVVSLIVDHAKAFVWVAVIGAVDVSIMYSGVARAGGRGAGRDRQRNRNRR